MPRKGRWEDNEPCCKNGHPYPPDTPRGADGRRLCLACRAEGRKPGRRPAPVAERFWRRVQKGGPDDCWLWLGATNGSGYGVTTRGGRATRVYAHRLAWELERGPIPEGLEIDHICRTRSCVNVRHMATVSHRENNRRSPFVVSTIAAHRTHCPAGHPYDAANTYRPPGAPTSRMCRACMAIREAARERDWSRGPNRGRPRH
jgi:hypothetical protein